MSKEGGDTTHDKVSILTSDGYSIYTGHSVDDGTPCVVLVETAPSGHTHALPPMSPAAARALAADLISSAQAVDPVGHDALAVQIAKEFAEYIVLAEMQPPSGVKH